MNARAVAMTTGMVVLLAGGRLLLGQHRTDLTAASAPKAPVASAALASMTIRTALPTEQTAKAVLNSTSRHPEWVNVPAGSTAIQTFVVYPERPDHAPVVLLTSNNQGLSDWMRAVGDQVAGQGFIAVVPDLLSGLGPHGGNTESFTSRSEIVKAFGEMDRTELDRRVAVMGQFASSMLAGNGKNVTLAFDEQPGAGGRIEAGVTAPKTEPRHASFELTEASWPPLMAFLTEATGNRFTPSPELVDLHAGMHGGHPMAQEPATAGGAQAPGRRLDLPPAYNRAKLVVAQTTRKHEWEIGRAHV
jgi:hypothetical protein